MEGLGKCEYWGLVEIKATIVDPCFLKQTSSRDISFLHQALLVTWLTLRVTLIFDFTSMEMTLFNGGHPYCLSVLHILLMCP